MARASRGRRRGNNFSMRLTDAERVELESLRARTAGPDALGPWLVWAARRASAVLPARAAHAGGQRVAGAFLVPNRDRRVGSDGKCSCAILDLCGGSGAWAKPYEDAGYTVVRVRARRRLGRPFVGDAHFRGRSARRSRGAAWTKRTALWGDFALPERGPFVRPLGSAMDRRTAAARAVTPPGFARAFFEANP